MDELIQKVCAQTGLSPELAKQAVEIVIHQLKQLLPPALASQLDALLDGKMPEGMGQMSSILGAVGGLLGGGDKK